jgi:hypothetical protein
VKIIRTNTLRLNLYSTDLFGVHLENDIPSVDFLTYKIRRFKQTKQYNTWSNMMYNIVEFMILITKCSVPERHFLTIMILEYQKTKVSIITSIIMSKKLSTFI